MATVLAVEEAASDPDGHGEPIRPRACCGAAGRGPSRGFWACWRSAAGAYYALKRPPPLTQRDEVLLAGFENKTGEAVFDATLSQALAVQLGQSPFLNIVSDDRVRETLPLMGRDAGERLDAELAREVCQRLSTRAMVRGSISRLGEHYVLLLEATECASGASLALEQGQAASAEEVLETLGRMSSRLRTTVGESLRSVRTSTCRWRAPRRPRSRRCGPTRSASRSDGAGRSSRRSRSSSARSSSTPASPPPRRRSRTVYGNLGEASKSIDYARLAYGQRNKVSQRERLFISYQYDDRVTGDLKQAADTLDVWKRTYPNDFQPANALAIIHNRLGRYERRRPRGEGRARAHAGASRSPRRSSAYAYRGLGRYEEARRVAEEVLARGVATVPTRRLALPARRAARRRRGGGGAARVGEGHARASSTSSPPRRRWRRSRDASPAPASSTAGASRLADGRSLRETGRSFAAHDAITRTLYGQSPRAAGTSARSARTRATAARRSDAVPRLRVLTVLGLLGAPEAPRMAQALAEALPDSTRGGRRDAADDAGGDRAPRRAAGGGGRGAQAPRSPTTPATWPSLIPRYLRGEAYLAGRGGDRRARGVREHPRRSAAPTRSRRSWRSRRWAWRGPWPPSASATRRRGPTQEFLEAWRDADADVPVLVAARKEHQRLGVR